MPARAKHGHATFTVDTIKGSDRYVVVYVNDDNALHPMIERRTSGDRLMTYKTLSIARSDAFQVSEVQPDDYPQDRLAVYDKQYSAVL